MKTPPAWVERIITLSLMHPFWDFYKLSNVLKLEGISISSLTVHSILSKHKMGNISDRLKRIEEDNLKRTMEENLQPTIDLTPEKLTKIENAKANYQKKYFESSHPGRALTQDTFLVGSLDGIGQIYCYVVIDTYSSYAFGFLHASKQPKIAVAFLNNVVLPFFQDLDLAVETIFTDNGREFRGNKSHGYEIFLSLKGIQHPRPKARYSKPNGYLKRFKLIIMDDFFQNAFRTKIFKPLELLQKDLDLWIEHYNTKRPEPKIPNLGRSPIETIKQYLERDLQNESYMDT